MSAVEPTPEQIQQALNDVTTKKNEFPLEVTIPGPHPQVFKGTTPQEVLDKLIAAQSQATQTIQETRAQAEQFKTELEQLKAKIPPPPVNANEEQKKRYYETWGQDPKQALMLQLSELLNVAPEQVPSVMRRAVENGVVGSAAEEFLSRTPAYPQTAQANELMRQRLMERYGTTADAATADNLIVVYHDLVNEGRIVPNQIPIQGVMTPNTPMPNLRGSSAPPNPVNDFLLQAREMPLEQLKAAIDKLALTQR